MAQKQKLTRRELFKSSALAAGTLALTGAVVPLAEARGSDTIRVGVIGCGGRGSGAAHDCVNSSPGVEIVALADAFEDRLKSLKGKYNVPNDRCFVGLDAYKKVLALEAGRGQPKILKRIKAYVWVFYPDEDFVRQAVE